MKVRGLYRNFYRNEDHLAIAKLLQSRRFKRLWVVSYDNAAKIGEGTTFRIYLPRCYGAAAAPGAEPGG